MRRAFAAVSAALAAALAVPTPALAEHGPVADCPPGFMLIQVNDPHSETGVNVAEDRNQDGFVCVNPRTGKTIDNNAQQQQVRRRAGR